MSEQYFTRPNVQPVITNIGTTPEQRQMSTSEFKAKFDEMPEAIQQYIKETLLTELDAFKQEFMTHQAENATDAHGINPACHVINTTSVSIASDVTTTQPFNAEIYDTDNIHDVSTNNSRLTCKTPGKYLVFAMVTFSENPTGLRILSIKLNGTIFASTKRQTSIPSDNFTLSEAIVLDLKANDYLEVTISQTSGVAISSVAYNTQYRFGASFGMVKVG